MSDCLKNSMRFLYLKKISEVKNNIYSYNFSYIENDDNAKDINKYIKKKIINFDLKDSNSFIKSNPFFETIIYFPCNLFINSLFVALPFELPL